MKVTVCDVGPRDGLQNEREVLPPARRAELVNRLAAAGVPRIETVSFVHPKRVPQMADAEQVVGSLAPSEGTVYAGLVLNLKGYERLAATTVQEVHVSYAASESFNQRNQNASVEESMAASEEIIARAHRDGRRATVTIGVAFGCPFEGAIAPGRVLAQAERLAAAGADEILFADTIGVGVPGQVRHLTSEGLKLGVPIGVHLHNTRNTGFVNAYAALHAGVSVLDASLGGIGGCPFAPRAEGNIGTEDLVYLLHGEGVQTGIDLDALIHVAEWLAGVFGRALPAKLYRAGNFDPGVRQ